MIHERKRCSHCQIIYHYQVSGYCCHEELNDDKYCPDCKKVIIEALKNVPVKIEMVWENYDEITIDDVKRIHEERKKDFVHEIFMPLFDLNDPSNINITGIITLDGKIISYSYWTKKDDYFIKVQMERNVETGEKTLWDRL